MAQPQKETILGNYTAFPRFPLDCESMEYIQENIKHLAIVAQIAGCDKLIIKGCTGNSQSRTEGYVYVRTGDDLVGEILYYPGGSGVRCGISTENINASANNETFTSAYTIRKLVSGTTGEWSWSDFRALSEITNSALKTLVDGKAASNHNHDTAYAAKNHNHDTAYAPKSHTHDDRYYTETEMDSKLALKAAANHNHDTVYSKLSHNHDTAYAPKSHNHSISEIINLQGTLDGKAAAGHNHDNKYATVSHQHDGRYYTKDDVDNKLSTKSNINHSHDSRYYTKEQVDAKIPQYESKEGSPNRLDNAGKAIIVHKVGRLATMTISMLPISNGKGTVNLGLYLDKWKPIGSIYGVGINTSNISGTNHSSNLISFEVTGSTLTYLNYGNVNALWGSITYMTKE